MKRSRRTRRAVVPGILALLVTVAVTFSEAPPAVAATELPTGFTDTEWVSGISRPYQMEFAPDGRLFVSQQGGRLRVIKNGVLLATSFLTVSVDSRGDRGLIGIAFDPAFSTNHFVYVYYTAPLPVPHNRVSRFTANGDVAVAGSEKILIELADLGTATLHNGGSIHFGADGKLYIATGDNVQGTLAQSKTSLLGKMLRLNPDGTIPTDNPFYTTTTGVFRSIWALGLRNPFTFGVQPGTGRTFINDVGAMTWEEIDDGASGANYGWPTTEGPTTDPRFTSPLFAYNHGSTTTTGCAIAGGTFYNPPVQQFPSSYLGKYFFADACSGWIRLLDPATKTAQLFLSGGDGLIDVKTGPDGSLYYLARLDGTGNPGFVHKVAFSGKPAISSQPTNVTVSPGQPATFNVVATGSAPLSYQWQRGGVNIAGAQSSSYTLQAPTLADSGAQFRVVVTNPLGSTTSASATLTVTNNRAPTGTILTPTVGTHYNAGATITFTGSATDPEDGTLPASAFAWEIIFHHNTHTHLGPAIGPGPTGNARSGTFVIPNTGETATDVFYRIHLTVTDSAGNSTGSFVDVLPHIATLTFAATPTLPGLQIILDGQPHMTPYSENSVVSMKRTLDVVSPQLLEGNTYVFSAWSDGGAANHTINSPNVATTYTAAFVLVASSPVAPTDFQPLVQARVLETRTGYGQVGYSGAKPTAGQTIELQVTGVGGVPTDAAAVVLNVTGDDPSANGFVTIWPCGEARPTASSLNLAPGVTSPNAVIAKVGAGGKVCLFTQSGTELLADVNGYFPASSSFHPLNPARVLETRTGYGQVGYSGAKPTAGQTIELQVTGVGGVPTDAAAVVLNVTGDDPSANGFVTIWPCGEARPTASSLNLAPGVTSPNAVIAKVGAGGKVCLFTQSGTELLADVNGYFPASSSFHPLNPARVLGTRTGYGQVGYSGAKPTAGQTIELQVTGVGGVPTDAAAVVLNVTGDDPSANGFVTIWPCGEARPTASSLNLAPGVTSPNAVIAKVGAGGKVCLFTQSGTELLADVNGYFPAN